MKEHKHAALLRMAADNADQLFECDDDGFYPNGIYKIESVLIYPGYNWRPVKTTKKIKRWLWSNKNGVVCDFLMSDEQANQDNVFLSIESKWTIKLLWSETEFEVKE